MRFLFVLLVFVLSALAVPEHAAAEQLNFSRSFLGSKVQFFYRWKGFGGHLHDLSFDLAVDDVEQGSGEFRPFDNNDATNYVYKALSDYAEKRSRRGLDIEIIRVRGGFEIEAKGVNEAELNREMEVLKRLRKQAMDEYVAAQFYTYVDEKTVMPDHGRVATRYVSAMRPVAEALLKETGGDTRTLINRALSFMQSIPYDVLKSRYTSNGAGFQTPYGLLSGNRGDCDTKSVALAAILRNFYPDLRMVVVYLPGHAFLGINVPAQVGDKVLELGGTRFVLSEPVGPGLVPLGQIAPTSVQLLNSHSYSYREIPLS